MTYLLNVEILTDVEDVIKLKGSIYTSTLFAIPIGRHRENTTR